MFTLTTDYAIVVTLLVQRADSRKFERRGFRLDGRRRQVPKREVIAPRHAALDWDQALRGYGPNAR